MTSGTKSESLAPAIKQLAEQVYQLGEQNRPYAGRIVRAEVAIDPAQAVDPLAWLNAQPDAFQTYWRSRDGSFEMAGLGAADIVAVDATPDFTRIARHIMANLSQSDPAARYYGGLRFDPALAADKRDERWNAFGSMRLVLNRFELVVDDDRACLACNLFEDELQEKYLPGIVATIKMLQSELSQADTETTALKQRQDFPDRDRWIDNVRQAVTSFGTGQSQKLVLARRASMQFSKALHPWSLLTRLRHEGDNSFLFGLHPGPHASFIGASPERLFRRESDQLFTEAMAGTRPRSTDDATDRALTAELSMSDKELWEHQLVVNGIRSGLDTICDSHSRVDGPAPFKLQRIQHLRTRFQGHLKPNVDSFQIIDALHPSAAVGGYPVETAPALLHQFEPFDRGWYAGQVGWIGEHAAEFAVAIRSALITEARLDLFSGAGIVGDSQPDAEWDEIETKIDQFLRLTNGATA